MFSVYLWSVYTGYGDVCFLYDPSNMASVSFEDNGSAHNTKRRKLKNYLAPGALFVFLLLVPVYIFPLQSTMSQSFHSIPSLNASNRTAQYWFVSSALQGKGGKFIGESGKSQRTGQKPRTGAEVCWALIKDSRFDLDGESSVEDLREDERGRGKEERKVEEEGEENECESGDDEGDDEKYVGEVYTSDGSQAGEDVDEEEQKALDFESSAVIESHNDKWKELISQVSTDTLIQRLQINFR